MTGRAVRVMWNMRLSGLFLVGPGIGVALSALIFGLPTDLRWAAAAMFGLSLFLFGILVRAEWRHLARREVGGRP